MKSLCNKAYFYNKNFLLGYSLNYSYLFLNNEGAKKLSKLNYFEVVDNNENTRMLNFDFIEYINNINENVLNECGK
ncbi:hypothetical protein [Acinetobacter indicus]|uniref:hypothetical protein n=1 Tax=Acinetobacter indicus TaxID=756892 RepID=UPI000948FD70|nr:hypothetical protein [Acinetobacter indicus]QIC77766.1 hypothetical protein FSC02_00795 [Acinetobacter indicus]